MWNLDKQNYDEEEKRLKERISKINSDNADFLMRQMAQKKAQAQKMNPHEYALNRPLLREVNQKLKGMSQYDGVNSIKSG